MRLKLAPLTLALLAAPLSADLITGRVVDASGNGVPGVNIDADDRINGGDAPLMNDGTDANGFFTTTIPAGVYRLLFRPPTPPLSTHLPLETDDIAVSGTVNLGTIVLPPGVALSGRCVDDGGIPLSGVNLDVKDLVTGDDVILQGDNTGAFGTFSIAVPATPILLQVKTVNVTVGTFAPRQFELTLGTSTSIGDVVLQDGFLLTGHVQTSGGTPISNVDVDVVDVLTDEELYTPGDNTNAAGNFSVVVPAGTFDVGLCPNPALSLVAQELSMLSVFANTNTGTTVLPAGVVLSGIVRDPGGAPISNADVDVRFSASGVAVFLCNDNTNGAGAYSVIVPTGTLDVTFSPAATAPCLGPDLHTNVVVSGATTLDGMLVGGVDTLPPVISVPTAPIVRAPKTSPWQVRVHYTVGVTDACDPAPSLVCSPPSGSLFSFGTTTVTCTAMDASGNTSVSTFDVIVTPYVRRSL